MDSNLDELYGRISTDIEYFKDKVTALLWSTSHENELDYLASGLFFNIKYEVVQFVKICQKDHQCGESTITFRNVSLENDCNTDPIMEGFYGRLSTVIDEFKEKFLLTACNTENSNATDTIESMYCHLFNNIKYEIEQLMNQSLTRNESNSARNEYNQKMEYLIKLQTISSKIACQLQSQFPW